MFSCASLITNYLGNLISTYIRICLTFSTGKLVGFCLPSVACNRTSFSDFGVTGVNLLESELSLPSSPTTTLAVIFFFFNKEVQLISLILSYSTVLITLFNILILLTLIHEIRAFSLL